MSNTNLENYWNETTLKGTPAPDWSDIIPDAKGTPEFEEKKEFLDNLYYLPINEFEDKVREMFIVNYNATEEDARILMERSRRRRFVVRDENGNFTENLKEGKEKQIAEEWYKRRCLLKCMAYSIYIADEIHAGSGNHTLAEVHKYFHFPKEIPDIYKK